MVAMHRETFTGENDMVTIRTRAELAETLFRGVGAELGVAAGAFSAHILRQERVSLLYSIDRWNDHHNMAEYMTALALLKSHGSRSLVIRACFDEIAPCIPNQHLQFCYVDGYAHTGQHGGKTLADWWPKIKPGGILSGHDYSPRYQPTIDAVDAFAKAHGLELNLTTEDELPSWWVRKPL